MPDIGTLASMPNIVTQRWLPPEWAIGRVVNFERFGKAHLVLACYCALPSLLTPELVNLIRTNFLGESTPWVAEIDLLLSDLCIRRGDGLYEVEPRVREVLLVELKNTRSQKEILGLAQFLHVYANNKGDKLSPDVQFVYRSITDAYLRPDILIQEARNLLLQSVEKGEEPLANISNQIQIIDTLELLRGPLEQSVHRREMNELYACTRILAYYLYGNSQQLREDLQTHTSGKVGESETAIPLFRSVLDWIINVDIPPNEITSIPDEDKTSMAFPVLPEQIDLPRIWNVPHARNPHFTGRDDLLERLHQQLTPAGQNAPAKIGKAALTQPQAIKGLGGIGKTQIAVEYAYRSRDQGHYTHTLWVNAVSEETTTASFVAIADLLPSFAAKNETDQRKLVEAVKRWLEQCQQRWLLIFDNADDVSIIQMYLPERGNGSILLTTRATAIGSLAASLEVEKMGLMEGSMLLLRRAQRLEHVSDEEQNEATNIVVTLDFFPLAIDQAGAYIEETGCGFAGYLAIYNTHRKQVLARRGRQATNYPTSVATTWSLSLQKIEQANPAAAELLCLCAFLDPDAIPEELIQDSAVYWTPTLQQASADHFTFHQMISELLKFSLVNRLVEIHMLSVHRLVQAVQMEMIEPDEQLHWAERVVRAVNAMFPRDPQDVATWPQCLRYLRQVQACSRLVEQYMLTVIEAADLLNRAGLYLYEHALYTAAEPLFQQALRIQKQIQDPDHVDVAFPLNNLAVLYTAQGKYAEAEPLHQRALAIREQQLGAQHPDTASSLNNLATLYRAQGKYTEAEPLFQRALSIREQQLGAQHPDTASSLNNLATLYRAQGKYTEAEPLFQRALSIREQQLGSEHPDTASSLNNLAKLYESQGRYAEAEPLYVRALSIREQQLGPLHPNTATSLNNLAELYRAQGKYEQAEPLYVRALSICEQQLGPLHPDTAQSLNNLAALYDSQGKYEQAEPLYVRALSIREQQLGTEHPHTQVIRGNYALLLRTMGRDEKATGLDMKRTPSS